MKNGILLMASLLLSWNITLAQQQTEQAMGELSYLMKLHSGDIANDLKLGEGCQVMEVEYGKKGELASYQYDLGALDIQEPEGVALRTKGRTMEWTIALVCKEEEACIQQNDGEGVSSKQLSVRSDKAVIKIYQLLQFVQRECQGG